LVIVRYNIVRDDDAADCDVGRDRSNRDAMSTRAAVAGENDVGTLVNREAVVLVLDCGLLYYQVSRRAVKSICVVASSQAVALRVGLVTLGVVDVDSRDCEGTRVGHAEGLRWRIDDVHVLEDTGYFNLHHGTWFCGSAVGTLAIPVERSPSVKAVTVSVKDDVVAANGEEWASPTFIAEKNVTVEVHDGVVRQRKREALTGWDSEAINVDRRAFLGR